MEGTLGTARSSMCGFLYCVCSALEEAGQGLLGFPKGQGWPYPDVNIAAQWSTKGVWCTLRQWSIEVWA